MAGKSFSQAVFADAGTKFSDISFPSSSNVVLKYPPSISYSDHPIMIRASRGLIVYEASAAICSGVKLMSAEAPDGVAKSAEL